jgi:hypothetical protein
MGKLKVFICDDHQGRWNPGASVIIAHNEQEARKLLYEMLEHEFSHPRHLDENGNRRSNNFYTIREIPMSPAVHVVYDGNE